MQNLTKKLAIEPNQSTGREITGKFIIGVLIGAIMSVLLFIILSFIGNIFTESMGQTGNFVKSNPILPLILLLIGFLVSFIGNLSVAGIYGMFFGDRYYKTSKTMGLLLLTNGLLFIIFAPIYFLFSSDINTLFIILSFHIMFSVFVSSNQNEIVSNPNYAASSLIGTIIGFTITILIYSIIRKSSITGGMQEKLYILLLLPPIISYAMIPLGLGLREKIYYKMYEIGNNGFYTPSVQDTNTAQTQQDIINPIDEDDDINIDLN